MTNFLNWLGRRFHNHDWETFQIVKLSKHRYGFFSGRMFLVTGDRFVMRCKVCGKFKYKDVI